MHLANNWTDRDVESALDGADTSSLVRFLCERHEERFFNPIRVLRQSTKPGFGFAIMALASLLIEELMCYEKGLPSTNRKELEDFMGRPDVPSRHVVPQAEFATGKDVFKDFFSREGSSLFPGVNGVEYYTQIRNGLLHQAQTRGGWKLSSDPSVALWDAENKMLNRNKFVDNLLASFEQMTSDLKQRPWADDRWNRVSRKIWWVVYLSRERNV